MAQQPTELDINSLSQPKAPVKQKTVVKQSVLEMVRGLVKKRLGDKVLKQSTTLKSGLGADSVSITPPAVSAAPVVQKPAISKLEKTKRSVLSGAKKRIAKETILKLSTELYFNIDNRLTFAHLTTKFEDKMRKLHEEHDVPIEELMDAKLEGKHKACAKMFETLCIMLSLENLLAGGRKNKKGKRKFAAKTNQFRTKLKLLGYDMDEKSLNESVIEKGRDFLSLIEDKKREVDSRLEVLDEFLTVESELV